ncbi:TetR/AcrR family transcriptional regulator [Smaragdicoccus niigatensis]|uniref:TetR/AcrR family transcriptional regulator n=1 Tax=Smaragdicoccus niigatensis TaxID=359359 RepID=UPI000688C433|nr:TetR/AcrR family transcriptional regulator [Smaragdicoccus niigatensis]
MPATPSPADRSGPTRTRAAHLGPERRRPLILDAARTIAAESGIPSVTIGSVAERLGVTRPVVYSCFADRVELLEALLDRESESLVSATIAAINAGIGHDIETSFINGLQAWLEVSVAYPDTWRLLASDPDPAIAEVYRAARAVVEDALGRHIRPALTELGVEDIARKMPTILMLFFSSCEAAALSLVHEPDKWTPAELGELYGRAIWRAFSAF